VGPLVSAILAVVIAVVGFIAIFTLLNLAVSKLPGKWEQRVRPWVFVGPALIFLFIGLFMPAVRTLYLSFRKGPRGEDGFTVDNYVGDQAPKGVFRDKSVITSTTSGTSSRAASSLSASSSPCSPASSVGVGPTRPMADAASSSVTRGPRSGSWWR
jgi:hypothetical protein